MKINLDKFFSTKWLILLLIPFFEPNIFVKYTLFNLVYAGLLCFVFLFLLLYYLIEKIKIPVLFFLVLIYRSYLLFPTIISNGDYLKWGYLSIVLLSMILVMNISIKKDYVNFFSSVVILFSILLLINLILFIVYPEGLYQNEQLYFLGIRTRFTDIAFPNIVFSLFLLKIKNKKECHILWAFSIILSLVTILMAKISTAIIGLVILLLLLFLSIFKEIRPLLTSRKLFFLSVFLTYLIVFLRIGDLFSNILYLLFDKTSTFSGRTEIWNNAYPIILKKIFFGYGIINDGNFVPWISEGNRLWQAHNQFLQLLYDGGLFSTIFFIFIIYLCVKKIGVYKLKFNSHIFVFGLCCLLIMMISEIYFYYPGPYLLLFSCYFFYYIPSQNTLV